MPMGASTAHRVFPQSLSRNPLIVLDTRFRGYDELRTLTFARRH